MSKTKKDLKSLSEIEGENQSLEAALADDLEQKLQGKNAQNEKGIWFETGITLIDLAAGAGRGMGIEAGDIIRVHAENQAGKTWWCNQLIAGSRRKYGDKFAWIYDDAEHGNNFDFTELYGISEKEVKESFKYSKTIEEVFARAMLFFEDLEKEDKYGIYVLDSWDFVTSKQITDIADDRLKAFLKNKEYDEGSFMGEKNKFASQIFYPQIGSAISNRGAMVIINQLRDNIGGGMYGPKNKQTGGRASDFAASNNSFLKSRAKIEVNDLVIGTRVQYEAKKARGNQPWRKVTYTGYFAYGIDNVGSNIDYLYDLLTADKAELKKSADSLEWDGVTYTREGLISFIETNNLETALAHKVIKKWDTAEEGAISFLAGRKKAF